MEPAGVFHIKNPRWMFYPLPMKTIKQKYTVIAITLMLLG